MRKITGVDLKSLNYLQFRDVLRDTTGVILYNALPVCIRNITGDLLEFKYELDRLLEMIPDQPALPGYVPGAKDKDGKSSNSIIDWLKVIDTSQHFPTTEAND